MEDREHDFQQRVLAFELQTGGSHPSYIRNFADLWKQAAIPATIEFVVTQQFLAQHPDVCDFVRGLSAGQIGIRAMSAEESALVQDDTLRKEFHGWKLCCQYARLLKATRSILMYSDRFQLPMLLGERSPCPVSCIYFRPTFHYREFKNYRPSLKQRLAAARKKLILRRFLKLNQLDVLFCLDPFAAEYIQRRVPTHARIRTLPDSFVRRDTPEDQLIALRNELGIQPGRRVLLLLGILDARKGAPQLLQAVMRLPQDVQQKLCLLLIGKIHEDIEADVLGLIRNLTGRGHAQIIANQQYVSDTVVQQYYEVSDVALTTYQRHMGMSSALIRAALARIPVLSSDYGVMGELVMRHQLGQVVDTESPDKFATAIGEAVTANCDAMFDVDSALDFAEQHSPGSLGNALKEWIVGRPH